MTAITFPLKKFPGQIKHNNIGFTGRISAHPIILAMLFLIQSSISVKYGYIHLRAVLSLIPLLYVVLVFSFYLFNLSKRGSAYFELPLEKYESYFEEDRQYFKRMFSIGLFLSLVVWIVSLQYPSMPELSKLVVNSILLITYFIHTTTDGVYSTKKILQILLNVVILEVAYLGITEIYPVFDIIIAPIIFVFFYRSLRRYEQYKPLQLLQQIIS